MEQGTIAYPFAGALYLNITNRCPVRCTYCIKYRWSWRFRGHALRLQREPTVQEIISALCARRISRYREIVFCGYGEPLLRYRVVAQVADWLRLKYPRIRIRVNTDGLANAFLGVNVCPALRGRIDVVSVSMNAANERAYAALHRTRIVRPLDQIKKFVKECKKHVSQVVLTSMQHPLVDEERIRQFAKRVGVCFRSRPLLNGDEKSRTGFRRKTARKKNCNPS